MARPKVRPYASNHDPRPATTAERTAKYKSTGVRVDCVLRDQRAIAALDRLSQQHGGVTAALTEILRDHQRIYGSQP